MGERPDRSFFQWAHLSEGSDNSPDAASPAWGLRVLEGDESLHDITDFPRSTAMMRYQLVNDDDVLGRIEAVNVLAQRPTDRLALDALVRSSRNDRFWAVRSRAVDALAGWGADSARVGSTPMSGVKDALLR